MQAFSPRWDISSQVRAVEKRRHVKLRYRVSKLLVHELTDKFSGLASSAAFASPLERFVGCHVTLKCMICIWLWSISPKNSPKTGILMTFSAACFADVRSFQ